MFAFEFALESEVEESDLEFELQFDHGGMEIETPHLKKMLALLAAVALIIVQLMELRNVE